MAEITADPEDIIQGPPAGEGEPVIEVHEGSYAWEPENIEPWEALPSPAPSP